MLVRARSWAVFILCLLSRPTDPSQAPTKTSPQVTAQTGTEVLWQFDTGG